jgi:hypothetical protein
MSSPQWAERGSGGGRGSTLPVGSRVPRALRRTLIEPNPCDASRHGDEPQARSRTAQPTRHRCGPIESVLFFREYFDCFHSRKHPQGRGVPIGSIMLVGVEEPDAAAQQSVCPKVRRALTLPAYPTRTSHARPLTPSRTTLRARFPSSTRAARLGRTAMRPRPHELRCGVDDARPYRRMRTASEHCAHCTQTLPPSSSTLPRGLTLLRARALAFSGETGAHQQLGWAARDAQPYRRGHS